MGLEGNLLTALLVGPAGDQAGIFVHHFFEAIGTEGPEFLAAAGEKEQGNAREVLGDGVHTGVDPDVILVRMGQAALLQMIHEQVGGEEKEAVRFGKGGEGRSIPFDQVAAGPDETGDSPADKRLHGPSPYMIMSLAHII